jgi:tetratricopeptide (TPR) repeat protein
MAANNHFFLRGILPWLTLIVCLSVSIPGKAQKINSNSVMNSIYDAGEQINKMGDEAKAKYAENIDNPYVPVKINREYSQEDAKMLLIRDLKKYVNYYFASKVPAYHNLTSNLTIRNIKNGEVTDDYVRFTSGSDNHSVDTVTIYFKDIVKYQITYYVKVADNGFYMPYVKVKDHLLTCGGKEVADLLFYLQHSYAVKFYEKDLEDFKVLALSYQTLATKPAISEEQRKFFVQGNLMNEKKNYGEAIIYYDKALSLNPMAFAAGYYNFALISGLAGRYEFAILNMKKYLMLEPNASDAVAAQDKIYEWEALMAQE